MGLLDLKSDLSAAFNRKTKTASDMINNPKASKLDYDASPKPYKIPNNGLGVGVKYDPTTQSFKSDSKLGDTQNTSNISGRHDISSIETKQSKLKGRHENTNVEIQSLAPTPAKTAVEPITISATPVKQGITPNILPKTANKVGTEITKIPIKGNIEKQAPEIITSFIGEQTLAEMDPGKSLYNIDDIPVHYASQPFMSQYIITQNNLDNSNLNTQKPSTLDIDDEPTPYATTNIIASQFSDMEDLLNPITGNIFTIDTTIVGSNIDTPYDVTFDDTLYTEQLDPDQSEYNQDLQTNFFEDLGSKRFDLRSFPNDSYPGMTSPPPQGGWFGDFGISLGTLSMGSHYIDNTGTLFHGEGPYFYWYDTGNNFHGFGYTNQSTHAVQSWTGNRQGFGDYLIKFSDQESIGINFFKGLQNSPNGLNNVLQGSWGISGFTPLINLTTPGSTGAHNPYINIGSNYPINTTTLQWNPGIQPRGLTGYTAGGTPIYQTLLWGGVPHMHTDFFPDLSLTNNFNIFTYSGVTHTNQYADSIIDLGTLTTDGSNYVIPMVTGNSPWDDINLTNYFDTSNMYQDGFKHYTHLAISGPPNDWTQWTAGSPMPSKYIGVTEGQYDNPGLFPTEIAPGVFASTNFFDSTEIYTKQFTIDVQASGEAFGSSNFVGILDDKYTAAEILLSGNYAHSSLFINQYQHWNIDIDNLGDIGHDSNDSDRYSPSGLPINEHGTPDFSGLVNEESGIFNHSLNSDFPYASILEWSGKPKNFNARTGWSGCPTPDFYDSYTSAAGAGNAQIFKSWVRTDSAYGAGDSAGTYDPITGEGTPPIYIEQDKLTFFHPAHNLDDKIYGWGLGEKTSLGSFEGTTHGSTNNLGWRLPFGNRHITYLGAPGEISTDNAWGTYNWPTMLYSPMAAASAGFVIPFHKGVATEMYLNPHDKDQQVFTSTGAGLASMGGERYGSRMHKLMQSDSNSPTSDNPNALERLWDSINPFDEMISIWDQMNDVYNATTKRVWEQHNGFSVILGQASPQGVHRGLAAASLASTAGRFLSLIPGTVGGLLTGGLNLSARKYWSVLGYAGLQMAATAIETGQVKQNDFRNYLGDQAAAHVGLAGVANYIDANIYKRHGYPESGTPGVDRRDYRKTIPNMGDNITMEDIISGDPLEGDYKDFIKFSFKDVVNNENFRFRAYISSLTDSIQPTWGQYNYVGRPDPVFQYSGVSARTISFNLKVAALARQDMYWMWKKINKLVGMCYPSVYEVGHMVGPMMEITIGDYVVAQPGFLNSLNVQVPDASPWEINQEGHTPEGSTYAGMNFGSLSDTVNSVSNAWNDPLGTVANIIEEENQVEDIEGRKNTTVNPPDAEGEYIAQLPHIVDLSIGYTLIGDNIKSAKGLHFGSKTGRSKKFFEKWDESSAANQNDAGESIFGGGVLGDAADWLGIGI